SGLPAARFSYPLYHDILSLSYGSSIDAPLDSLSPNLFFLSTTSIFYQDYAIARNPNQRGINYATMKEVFRRLTGEQQRMTTAPASATISSESTSADSSA